MQVNGCGRVTLGNGTPVGRETSPQIDSPVRTRKASPEELAELDAALKKKYGEKKPAPKKAKANAVDAEAAKMRKHGKPSPRRNGKGSVRCAACQGNGGSGCVPLS